MIYSWTSGPKERQRFSGSYLPLSKGMAILWQPAHRIDCPLESDYSSVQDLETNGNPRQKGCGLIVGKRTTPVFFFVLLGIIVFFLIYAGVRRSQQTPPPEPSLRQNR